MLPLPETAHPHEAYVEQRFVWPQKAAQARNAATDVHPLIVHLP